MEEERFRETLNDGMKIVNEIIKAKAEEIVKFRQEVLLYDDMGSP